MTDQTYYGTTTYSPEDDKLRFYMDSRLPNEIYAEFKKAGFIYAPKQGCVLQVFSPEREEICLRYSPEVGDDDTSMFDRADERAERFEKYADNRTREAEQAHSQVDAIAERFAGGQPILIGHHSERRARKDKERIENGMRKAINLFETADYWKRRAYAAKRHARYLQRADVRYRRIKKLEADLRKQQKNLKGISVPVITYELRNWSFEHKDKSDDEIKQLAQERADNYARRCERWIAHLTMRIEYEKAMLDDQGGVQADRLGKALEVGGAVKGRYPRNYCKILRVTKRDGEVLSVTVQAPPGDWRKTYVVKYEEIQYVLTPDEYNGYINGTFAPVENVPAVQAPRTSQEPKPATELKAALKAVEEAPVVVADQLFPTPLDLAYRMVNNIAPLNFEGAGAKILEPSAGTGALIGAVSAAYPEAQLYFCEINFNLQAQLSKLYASLGYDFMDVEPGELLFDRIYMNPPFAKQQDIKHVRKAYELLAEGGCLVAIMSEHGFIASTGEAPAFREWLDNVTGQVEKLPANTFEESGTKVNTRLVTIWK